MKNKKNWLGILVFLLTLVFIVGCNNDDKTDDEADDKEPFPKGNAVLTLKIEKNQYSINKSESKGNQKQLSFTDMNTKFNLDLAIPVEGEKYTLKFKFFSDKDITPFGSGASICIALVDTNKNANGTDTYWFIRGKWNIEVTGGDIQWADINNVKKNTLISFTGTITVIDPSTASSAQAGALDDYKLVFETLAQPWNDEATLYFQSFEFKKN